MAELCDPREGRTLCGVAKGKLTIGVAFAALASLFLAGCGGQTQVSAVPSPADAGQDAVDSSPATDASADVLDSATPDAGADASPGACVSQDSAQLWIDAASMAPLSIVNGTSEQQGNSVGFILSHHAKDGTETEILLYLRDLALGTMAASASSSLEYRRYAPGSTPSPPVESFTLTGSDLTGTIDVTSVATNPTESICGTFDLAGKGTRSVKVSGAFHHYLAAPQP